jgi:hypothetical protein
MPERLGPLSFSPLTPPSLLAAFRIPQDATSLLLLYQRGGDKNESCGLPIWFKCVSSTLFSLVIISRRSDLDIMKKIIKNIVDIYEHAPSTTPARTSFGQAVFKNCTPQEVAQVTHLKANTIRKLFKKQAEPLQSYFESLVRNLSH